MKRDREDIRIREIENGWLLYHDPGECVFYPDKQHILDYLGDLMRDIDELRGFPEWVDPEGSTITNCTFERTRP